MWYRITKATNIFIYIYIVPFRHKNKTIVLLHHASLTGAVEPAAFSEVKSAIMSLQNPHPIVTNLDAFVSLQLPVEFLNKTKINRSLPAI